MKDKLRLLIISWTIPPAHGGSAYITHQLLKNFNAVEVIAVGGTTQPFRGTQQYDGVHYHYLFSEINWKGHGDRFFAPLRYLLFPVVLVQAWYLARKHKLKVILATFPDGYYLSIGYLLSRILGLPLYSYFHNTYSENRTGLSKVIASFVQDIAFKKSVCVFTMSEGMRHYYMEHYPLHRTKFRVLQHTFNEYPPKNMTRLKALQEGRIRLIFIGTLNQSNLDASRRLFKAVSANSITYQLDVYSPSNKNLLKIKYGLDLDLPGIRHCGVVRQEEVNAVLQNYDICVLTHGFSGQYDEIEYQTIFPTRTIPFLLSGKPILAHTPPGVFLTQFLKERDCAEVVDEADENAIVAALNRLANDPERKSQLIRNQSDAVHYFYGPEVVAQFKAVLMSAESS